MARAAKQAGRKDGERRKALVGQMQFLGQMASTETALFHQAAAAKLGLGITDTKTISVLLQEGAMTAGQLGRRLSLTSGAVTNVIDRLERRGIVQRASDAKDRRKVIVTVNENKLAAADKVYRSVGKAFERLLATYATAELEFLVRYLQASIELTKQEIAKLA